MIKVIMIMNSRNCVEPYLLVTFDCAGDWSLRHMIGSSPLETPSQRGPKGFGNVTLLLVFLVLDGAKNATHA